MEVVHYATNFYMHQFKNTFILKLLKCFFIVYSKEGGLRPPSISPCGARVLAPGCQGPSAPSSQSPRNSYKVGYYVYWIYPKSVSKCKFPKSAKQGSTATMDQDLLTWPHYLLFCKFFSRWFLHKKEQSIPLVLSQENQIYPTEEIYPMDQRSFSLTLHLTFSQDGYNTREKNLPNWFYPKGIKSIQ